MKVTVLGMRPGSLIHLYRSRLQRHPVPELFAGAGIAVGVALVFAVQVANTSITAPAEELVHGLTGDAKVQVAARSSKGFDERLTKRVADLPGVRHVAPLLRARIFLVGPEGRRSVELIGATPAIATLDGELTQDFGSAGLQLTSGIGLPSGIAEAIGAESRRRVTLIAEGRRQLVQCCGGTRSGHWSIAQPRSRRWRSRRTLPAGSVGFRSSSLSRKPVQRLK
jgi:putative ABC transport system permease protein